MEEFIALFFAIALPTVCAFSYAGYRAKLWHEQLKLGLIGQDGKPSQVDHRALAELREEVARLRSISNEYDLSLQHRLEDVQQRLATVEGKSRNVPAARPVAGDEGAIQSNGRNY